MTFKFWGTTGFYMMRGTAPDTSGAIGTASGDVIFDADNVIVGGKTLVGKDLKFKSGSGTLLKGPVRTLGDFSSGTNGNLSYQGTFCIEGEADYGAALGIAQAGGTLLTGENAKTGKCSYDAVSAVFNSLKVPKIVDSTELYDDGGSIDVSGEIRYIDVPRIEEGEGKLWDLYFKKIDIHNGGELRVRLPPNGGGRLVRIFLDESINFYAGSKLRVQYVNEDAEFVGGAWTKVTTDALSHKDYAGNLLVYMKNDVNWDSFQAADSIQGSLITQGTMTVGSNLHLAGQLIAENLNINAEFDGKGFRYVPFDPAILDPKLFATVDFEESGKLVEVPVRLDTNTLADVYFNYCFDLTDEEPVNGKTSDQRADLTDFDSIPYLCGVDTGPGRVTILAGSKYPTEDSKIYINVALDPYKEAYGSDIKEQFTLKVFDMVGAVLRDNAREGSFTLNVVDKNIYPVTRDTTFAVLEDDTIRFASGMFPYYSLIDSKMTGVRIEQLPNSKQGSLIYKGKSVSKNQIIPVDSLEDLIFVPVKNFYDVDSDVPGTSVKFAVVDANKAISSEDKDSLDVLIGSKELTIAVKPVNDPPVAGPATFTVSGHVILGGSALDGSIPVTDVDDKSFTYAFDSTDKNFALVDSLFEIDSSTGEIHVKDGIELNENVADTQYSIVVVVSDKSASTGLEEDIHSAKSAVTIKVTYTNTAPVIQTDTVRVVENSKSGSTADSTLKAFDKDASDTLKVYTLIGSSNWFEVSEDGVISVKEGAKVDYEKSKSETLTIEVCDEYNGCSRKEVVVKIVDVKPSDIKIVEGVNNQDSWEYPKVIKTNDSTMTLYCNLDGEKDKKECMDTVLVDGCHDYVVENDNPDLDGIAYDTVQICLSTATPFVFVGINETKVTADNIYTIVEKVDADDPRTYVNGTKNDIHVIVNDSVSGVKKDYTVTLDLDTVGVPKSSLNKMESVVKANVDLDVLKSADVVIVNGDTALHSYKVAIDGKDSVVVSYKTDSANELAKVPVVNDKGKVEYVEVYTVTYVTQVNGRETSVSYTVNADTKEMLLVDSDGNLMTEEGAAKKNVNAVPYTVSYDYVDAKGNSVNVSYGVDESGNQVKNSSGDIGYKVSYTYVNEYGNSATESIIVVLDYIGPKVVIVSPVKGSVIRSNYVEVIWEVDGIEQDTLKLQSLEKSFNPIVRYFKDKAGNVVKDSIFVFMKDAKNVNVSREQPVTEITKDKVEEYYAANPPEEGEKYAVSIYNPKTGKEMETLIGGSFGRKEGSGDSPYPGFEEKNHLGPTLVMDIKLPVVNGVGGLATLDDLVGSDGRVPIDGVDAANSRKISLDEYVEKYCEKGFDYKDPSKSNLYDIKSNVKIWVYTSLGNFVDYFTFSQKLNNPEFTDDVGLLQMYFEQKPKKDGHVRDANGRQYATGAYLYKVEVDMNSKLRCTLPPVDDAKGKKMGDRIPNSDRLLKPFGYKRPNI